MSTNFKTLLTSLFAPKHSTIEDADLLFRRKTNRYAPKGTISSNKGYLRVARDTRTGRFTTLER